MCQVELQSKPLEPPWSKIPEGHLQSTGLDNKENPLAWKALVKGEPQPIVTKSWKTRLKNAYEKKFPSNTESVLDGNFFFIYTEIYTEWQLLYCLIV